MDMVTGGNVCVCVCLSHMRQMYVRLCDRVDATDEPSVLALKSTECLRFHASPARGTHNSMVSYEQLPGMIPRIEASGSPPPPDAMLPRLA